MTDSIALEYAPPRAKGGFLIYGSLNVLIAAIAMIATLPGRTYGLGIITEQLLAEFHLTQKQFAQQNLWATLIGATFVLAWGPLIDWLGSRIVLAMTFFALGATVISMGSITGTTALLITITLTRGFGQSSLSAVSLALVGKWFSRRLPMAMAIYSALVGIGFTIAIPAFSHAVQVDGWKQSWVALGWILVLILTPLAVLLVRRTPESVGLEVDGQTEVPATSETPAEPQTGLTLSEALASPAFWAYALSASAFGLVNSGLMLFNSSVLMERGIQSGEISTILAVILFSAMLANFIGGWLARTWPIGRLMAMAMILLAVGLVALPLGHGHAMVYTYAVMMGLSAGIVTVAFFICWGQVFGRQHLGAIQGAAQGLTVLASAVGPLLLAVCTEKYHSTTRLFFISAPIMLLLAVFCAFSPLPRNSPARRLA